MSVHLCNPLKSLFYIHPKPRLCDSSFVFLDLDAPAEQAHFTWGITPGHIYPNCPKSGKFTRKMGPSKGRLICFLYYAQSRHSKKPAQPEIDRLIHYEVRGLKWRQAQSKHPLVLYIITTMWVTVIHGKDVVTDIQENAVDTQRREYGQGHERELHGYGDRLSEGKILSFIRQFTECPPMLYLNIVS